MASSSLRLKTSGGRAQQGFVEAGPERYVSDWVDVDGLSAVVSDQPPTFSKPAAGAELPAQIKAGLDRLLQRWLRPRGMWATVRESWRQRRADPYVRLLEAEALGRWSEMAGLAGQLRTTRLSSQMEFDLAARMAALHARQGDLDGALEDLAPWRSQQTAEPGAYEARVAEVHAAAGNRTGHVRLLGKAQAASEDEAGRVLAHALAQARFGDLADAQALMARIDQAPALPPQTEAQVLWAQGLIAMRQGRGEALDLLNQALAEFLQQADDAPSTWPALAQCACDQAILLNACGQRGAARSLLKRVMPVLRAHADRPLMALLKRERLLSQR